MVRGIAAALPAVSVVLGVLPWRAFLRARGLRAALLAGAGSAATALGVLPLVTVIAQRRRSAR